MMYPDHYKLSRVMASMCRNTNASRKGNKVIAKEAVQSHIGEMICRGGDVPENALRKIRMFSDIEIKESRVQPNYLDADLIKVQEI